MTHVRDFIGAKIPAINRFIIGGDFNTNHDQAMFAAEKTLDTLGTGDLCNVFEKLPFEQRITHPGTHGFPDATFDYFFSKNVVMGKPVITQTNVSDHLPVTCDVTIQ
jgi:endonuclease/exonuclease/phosphatase family metal-dependent hydrolase